MSETLKRRLIDQIGDSPTFVAEGSRLTGDVESAGPLVVCGAIRGDGRVGGALRMAVTAEWDGEIHARAAVIAGRISGRLVVEDKLEVGATAVLRGGHRGAQHRRGQGRHHRRGGHRHQRRAGARVRGKARRALASQEFSPSTSASIGVPARVASAPSCLRISRSSQVSPPSRSRKPQWPPWRVTSVQRRRPRQALRLAPG